MIIQARVAVQGGTWNKVEEDSVRRICFVLHYHNYASRLRFPEGVVKFCVELLSLVLDCTTEEKKYFLMNKKEEESSSISPGPRPWRGRSSSRVSHCTLKKNNRFVQEPIVVRSSQNLVGASASPKTPSKNVGQKKYSKTFFLKH